MILISSHKYGDFDFKITKIWWFCPSLSIHTVSNEKSAFLESECQKFSFYIILREMNKFRDETQL